MKGRTRFHIGQAGTQLCNPKNGERSTINLSVSQCKLVVQGTHLVTKNIVARWCIWYRDTPRLTIVENFNGPLVAIVSLLTRILGTELGELDLVYIGGRTVAHARCEERAVRALKVGPRLDNPFFSPTKVSNPLPEKINICMYKL